MKTKLLLFFLFISLTLASQTTWYSYQSGNWAIGGTNWRTWTLDPSGTTLINPTTSQPGITDNVVILNGRIVTIPTGEAAKTVASVTIQEGAVLDITNTTGHTFGANLNGSGLLRLSTANFPSFASGTFVAAGGGTVEYRNMAGFTLQQFTYNNLIINLAYCKRKYDR
jgi:fibronectin-binding autotransporter adhesin